MAGFVVVDASLAVKWAIPEPFTEQALALAQHWAGEGTRLIAPCLILAEMTNALYKRVKRREINSNTAAQALRVILGFGIEIREEAGLPDRALALASELNMPTTYDAQYLALAEKYDCDCWTGDKRLYNSVKNTFPWVQWVGGTE